MHRFCDFRSHTVFALKHVRFSAPGYVRNLEVGERNGDAIMTWGHPEFANETNSITGYEVEAFDRWNVPTCKDTHNTTKKVMSPVRRGGFLDTQKRKRVLEVQQLPLLPRHTLLYPGAAIAVLIYFFIS